MEQPSGEPIIVCPLEFERAALVRQGILRPERVLCIGPGGHGVDRLARMLREDPGGPVVLAGLAGAVDPEIPAASAHFVGEVIGENGLRYSPSWHGSRPATSIATSREVLATPELKAKFATATGAQLADMESEPFARLAEARRWTWAIARGVSDDLQTSLPQNIHTWVGPSGQTKIGPVIASCARRPWQIGSLLALRRNSAAALQELARLLKSELSILKSQS